MRGKGRCAAVLASIILSAAFGKSALARGGIQVGTLTCNASRSARNLSRCVCFFLASHSASAKLQ